MKSSVIAALVVSCALIFAVGAFGQKELSMTGCLRATPSKADKAGRIPYILTNVEGSGPVGIVSSNANLDAHVGHKIEITGAAVPKPLGSGGPGAPQHYMKVTSMKMIAVACP